MNVDIIIIVIVMFRLVQPNIPVPPDTKIIDASGKLVLPGRTILKSVSNILEILLNKAESKSASG